MDKHIYNPWICHNCLEHHDSTWVKRECNNEYNNPLSNLYIKEIPTIKREYKYKR